MHVRLGRWVLSLLSSLRGRNMDKVCVPIAFWEKTLFDSIIFHLSSAKFEPFSQVNTYRPICYGNINRMTCGYNGLLYSAKAFHMIFRPGCSDLQLWGWSHSTIQFISEVLDRVEVKASTSIPNSPFFMSWSLILWPYLIKYHCIH